MDHRGHHRKEFAGSSKSSAHKTPSPAGSKPIPTPESPKSHHRTIRSHQRKSSVVKIADTHVQRRLSPDPASFSDEDLSDSESDQSSLSSSSSDEERENPLRIQPHARSFTATRAKLTSPSVISNLTSLTVKTNESGSSSGSGSTITQASYNSHKSDGQRRGKSPNSHSPRAKRPAERPDALSFLDPDSPQVTQESIEQSLKGATYRQHPDSPSSTGSPSNRSTSSSISSGSHDDALSDTIGDHETDRSTSPERSLDGDNADRTKAKIAAQMRAAQRLQMADRYGTPEMPRGSASLPHIPPSALTPRIPAQGHPKHLPRAEKLPLTGYELLASKLSGQTSDRTGPYIKPMYRRFDALNHRLLLHLQDEICELEEQLHRLDTADTQTRRMQSCILPSSRRTEYMSGGELQWHRTDILGKIGFKLEQYNTCLKSFAQTSSLPCPSLSEIHDYRTYLATHNPIAEIETRFLDATDDLVCLPEETGSEIEGPDDYFEDGGLMLTPMPGHDFQFSSRNGSISEPSYPGQSERKPSLSESARSDTKSPATSTDALEHVVPRLALAAALAFVVPMLTFAVIPGFMGRMTVILLVGIGSFIGLVRAGIFSLKGELGRDGITCAALYGAVMAVLAGVVS